MNADQIIKTNSLFIFYNSIFICAYLRSDI